MSDSGQKDQTIEHSDTTDAEPACVALVPIAQRTEWTGAGRHPARPASTFVAQLLATAEHVPQTRNLRRATAADAQAAYGSNRQARIAGTRTRYVA